MRITILTYGSRGDVQPCLALAVALRQAGHAPLLALPGSLRGLADDLAIPVAPLPDEIAQLSQRFNQAGQNLFAIYRAMQQYVEPLALAVARAAYQACQGADCVVHTFLFTLGAHAFARQLGIPDVSAQFFPSFFASSAYPQVAFPRLPLGPAYNRLTHHLAGAIFSWAQRMMYPRVRKAEPAFPARLRWPFIPAEGRPATPLLLAYSPALVPPEPDWGAHVHATGSWFLDSPAGYQPPPELARFLAEGPPPVCAGFGSMIHPDAPALQQALLAGIREAGQRALILTGWDGWDAAEPAPDRLFLPAAPHDWLFSRCAAVLHHCGAGTTAAALRAGQPQIALPLAVDQPFWASRVHAAGASPAPLNPRRLMPARVAAAVHAALTDPAICRRAAALGAAVRAEDGLAKAVRVIEQTADGR